MKENKFDYLKFLENEKKKVQKKYDKYKEHLEMITQKIYEEKEFNKLKKDM